MNEMEVISHLNVSVGLFPFTKILNLNIDHGPNVFGLCTIVGEMDHESADEIAQRTDESSETEVVTTASGQPARLFCGQECFGKSPERVRQSYCGAGRNL